MLAAALAVAALGGGCSDLTSDRTSNPAADPTTGVDTPPATSTSAPPAPAPALPPELARLADRTTMTDAGRDLFARSRPELVGKELLGQRCTIPEETNVLGCYHTDGRIAILDVADPRLDGMEEVTAAHELLHAVWDRLDAAERSRLTTLLRAADAANDDPDLRAKVEAYRRRDPGVVDNELHSILGTEVAALVPELEAHYAAWFADRSTVVVLAQQAQRAFADLEAAIDDLDAQLAELAVEIDRAEEALDRSRAAIDARSAQLEALREAGRIDEYNAGVDPFNTAVRNYNAAADEQRRRVDRYNGTVAVRNALGADHDELVEEITTEAAPVLDAG